VKLRLESAIADERDDAVRAELVAADHEVDRLSAIVTRLLALASQREGSPPATADLRELADRAADRWQRATSDAQITVTGPPTPATVHAADVSQILDTLLDNARIHAPGRVDLEAGHDDGHVWIAVRDHGPGMSAETSARATERFYRAPGRARGGSGLGLAIARELAERDEGTLTIEADAGGGTRVEVRYPMAEVLAGS
jgi:signal transduction histidine kinase